MVCLQCKSNNVTIQMENLKSKTKKTDNTIIQKAGHKIVRNTAGLFTLGISNLFIPKKLKGNEKTINKMEKICICQNCGYSWQIK